MGKTKTWLSDHSRLKKTHLRWLIDISMIGFYQLRKKMEYHCDFDSGEFLLKHWTLKYVFMKKMGLGYGLVLMWLSHTSEKTWVQIHQNPWDPEYVPVLPIVLLPAGRDRRILRIYVIGQMAWKTQPRNDPALDKRRTKTYTGGCPLTSTHTHQSTYIQGFTHEHTPYTMNK